MGSGRRKRKKTGKRLLYGIIAITFVLACILTYFYLQQSHPEAWGRKAAIVDHLSFRNETANQTFVNASKNVLEKAGFVVDYYGGEEVTVDFYKGLLTRGYSLIVLRVHSALIGTTESLGLFTSEHYDPDNIPPAYYEDAYHKRLVEAYFTEEERERGESYFAITPNFIEEYGNFRDTTVIMMGCDGLKYNKTSEAFIEKGAKVCIGWNGLVSTPHTDYATTCLLQCLARENTVDKAVENTMNEVGAEKTYFQDQGYKSVLKYYPEDVGSYTIQLILGISP
jgi:Predicted integral membrane protein